MSPFTPPSIRDEGLQKHLDSNYSDYGGYSAFTDMMKYGLSIRAIARKFHVSRPTVNKWVKIYKETGDKAK